jgi:membrane associated rhomboid family serine protease
MLEDRSYMRPSSFSSGRSAAVILLIANAAAFILQLVLYRYSSIRVDELFALSINGLRHGYVWQLLTFQFMHAGWLHLLVNCWVIYVFGRELEETLGRKAFWLLYFSSGILGGLLQIVVGLGFGASFAAPVVGASAGAFGLVAAFATIAPERMLTLLLFFIIPVHIKAKFLVLISGIIAVVGILVPTDNVAHAAHLGGIIGGILFIKYGLNADWRWPSLSLGRLKRRPAMRVHAEKVSASWPKPGKFVDVEDLPPDEFLSREVDPILDKISAHGIHSLTDRERRILEKARSKMVKR